MNADARLAKQRDVQRVCLRPRDRLTHDPLVVLLTLLTDLHHPQTHWNIKIVYGLGTANMNRSNKFITVNMMCENESLVIWEKSFYTYDRSHKVRRRSASYIHSGGPPLGTKSEALRATETLPSAPLPASISPPHPLTRMWKLFLRSNNIDSQIGFNFACSQYLNQVIQQFHKGFQQAYIHFQNLTWLGRWFVTFFHCTFEEFLLVANRCFHKITRMRWGSLKMHG